MSIQECAACSRAVALYAGPDCDQVYCDSPNSILGHASVRSAAEHTPVSSVMSNYVLCVREDVDVETITSILSEQPLGGLPVVDDNGHALGVVSQIDLARYQHDHASYGANAGAADTQPRPDFDLSPRTTSVSAIMTPIPFTVPEEASVASAAAVMASRNLQRLPVVDHLGTVIGLLTTTDIVDWALEHAPRMLSRRARDTDSSSE